jgi:hypothetical protein
MTARRWMSVNELSAREIVEALNTRNHQLLAHEVFMNRFTKAVKSKEISGFKRSSLFRMTLAYFLLVPDAPAKFRAELQAHLR